jgi:hypothetical protein
MPQIYLNGVPKEVNELDISVYGNNIRVTSQVIECPKEYDVRIRLFRSSLVTDSPWIEQHAVSTPRYVHLSAGMAPSGEINIPLEPHTYMEEGHGEWSRQSDILLWAWEYHTFFLGQDLWVRERTHEDGTGTLDTFDVGLGHISYLPDGYGEVPAAPLPILFASARRAALSYAMDLGARAQAFLTREEQEREPVSTTTRFKVMQDLD